MYEGEHSSFKDKFEWHDVASFVFILPSDEESYFTTTLGYQSSEYFAMKAALENQHTSGHPDFAHMQISLAARLAYRLDLDGLASNLCGYLDEDVSYLAGWLGDAIIDEGGTTHIGNDDDCADLDAENIYRRIIQGEITIQAINSYYSSLTITHTRAAQFLNHIRYSMFQEKIFYGLVDKELSLLMRIASEQGDLSLVKYYLA